MRQYILAICAASCLCFLWQALAPEGNGKKRVWYLGSLALILVILSPVAQLDSIKIQAAGEDCLAEAEAWAKEAKRQNLQLLESLINERCKEYIWKQAARLEPANLEVHCSFVVCDGIPIPDQITLTGQCSPRLQAYLQTMIHRELEIPPERQEWHIHE